MPPQPEMSGAGSEGSAGGNIGADQHGGDKRKGGSGPTATSQSPAKSAQPGSQAFIYPIRSAVSVKPPSDKRRASEASSSWEPQATGPLSPGMQHSMSSDVGARSFPLRPSNNRTNSKSSHGFRSAEGGANELAETTADDDEVDVDEKESQISSKHGWSSIEQQRDSQATPTYRQPLNGEDTEATEPLTNAEKDEIEEMTQMRFKHVETEDGHMILTGRDGVLMRCEDEVSK